MIEVQGLRFTYPGSRGETIRGIDFDVRPGEIFGFLGPSGAGKSTTQKIVIGVLRGWSGSIRIGGKRLEELGRRLYERIGVSFEMPTLYSKLTARENLELFRALYRGETEEPLHLLSLVGLEEDADTRVSGFSKGMKMRLNLCRALVNHPEVLFLDEPTTGQDPGNARRIKDLLLDLKGRGRTIFLTTHNMSVADEVCDRVSFIVDGRISLTESPRKLKIEHGRRSVRIEYGEDGAGRRSADFPLEGIGANAVFLDLLRNRRIETIHTLEASLEEIFLQVTGRSLT